MSGGAGWGLRQRQREKSRSSYKYGMHPLLSISSHTFVNGQDIFILVFLPQVCRSYLELHQTNPDIEQTRVNVLINTVLSLFLYHAHDTWLEIQTLKKRSYCRAMKWHISYISIKMDLIFLTNRRLILIENFVHPYPS